MATTISGTGVVTSDVNTSTLEISGSLTVPAATLSTQAVQLGQLQNASLSLTPSQTTGIVGTTTNNNANAGAVGEYISATTTTGNAVTLTTNTQTNVISGGGSQGTLVLTAGDWDVSGYVSFNCGASNVYTGNLLTASISSTSASGTGDGASVLPATGVTCSPIFALPTKRFSLTGSTTIYLVAIAGFSAGSVTVFGTLRARRVR